MNKIVTLNEFYVIFYDIFNVFSNLGEKIKQLKLVCKLFNSLTKTLKIKVTTIKESKNVDTQNIDELVLSIQTYELMPEPPKNNKNVALKNTKNEFCGGFDNSFN